MKLFQVILLPVLVLFIQSCVITFYKEPPAQGRVFDYETKKPIEGAIVQLYNRPKTQTVSDSNGFFATKTPRRFGFVFIGDVFGIELTACHPNYQCKKFMAWIPFSSSEPIIVFKGDVFLGDPNS